MQIPQRWASEARSAGQGFPGQGQRPRGKSQEGNSSPQEAAGHRGRVRACPRDQI